jgi:DNA-binding NtrC family response regulator
MDDLRHGGETTRSFTTEPVSVRAPRSFHFLVVERASSRSVPLPPVGFLLIGRGAEADIRLDDPSVSRKHARVMVQEDAVRLIDLDSRNGIRVNGAPIQGAREISLNDVVSVGEVTLHLRRPAQIASPEEGRDACCAMGPGDDPRVRTLSLGDRTVLLADPAMDRLFSLIERLAAADVAVLVVGETGAGKEHAAFAVHHGSTRRSGPFVCVNCAAIPDTLVESEFFGFEKGAFSGAHTAKPGLFERASGGTLFLDEVGELSLSAQAKLLRVLEGGHFARLGETRERKADVRIVAATNRDVAAEVKARRFREDLYYRLSAAVVLIPPLRERPADIPVLARRFLADARARAGKGPLEIAPAAMLALARHGWPGNVRELRNAMEYAAASTSDGVVERSSLPRTITGDPMQANGCAPSAAVPAPGEAPGSVELRPLAEEIEALERRRIREALAAAGGVKSRAARLISMPERTFRLKLRQYNLDAGRTGEG